MARITDDLTGGNTPHNPSDILNIEAGADGTIRLPEGVDIAQADILRDGADLILRMEDGSEVLVEGYFLASPPPMIFAANGTGLSPDLVKSFAHDDGPLQFAQNATMTDASPIGFIEEAHGEATITRTDGSTETITVGTPVFQGDIVETNGDGAVNIVFADESSFAVSNNARLAIDEYVYDPATDSGSSNFSMLRGMFVYTSGLIGREDPDDVEIDTPMGSIGIRGTVIAGDVDSGEITVVEGAIVLKSFSGSQVTLATQYETGKFIPETNDVVIMGTSDTSDLGDKYASVGTVAPDFYSGLETESEPAGQEIETQSAPSETTEEITAPSTETEPTTEAAPVETSPEKTDTEDTTSSATGDSTTEASATDTTTTDTTTDTTTQTTTADTTSSFDGSTETFDGSTSTFDGSNDGSTTTTTTTSTSGSTGTTTTTADTSTTTSTTTTKTAATTDSTTTDTALDPAVTTSSGTTTNTTPPIQIDARNDSFTTSENVIKTGDVLLDNGSGADSDPQSDSFSVTLINSVAAGTTVLGTNGGLFNIDASGNLTFDPSTYFDYLAVGQSTTTSASYTIQDSNGNTDTATVTMTVTGTNDAPVQTTNTGASGSEGATIAITTAELSASDVDTAGGSLTYTVTTAPTNGQLELTSAPGTPITSFTQQDLVDGKVIFVHDGSETTADSFSFTLSDGTTTLAADTFNLSITPVNDAPTGNVTVTGTAAEDATLTADTSGIADADGLGTFAYQWQTSNDGGATWTNISGATASTYTLGDADVGNEVRVNVSYTDGNGTTETLDSATTGTIANVNDAPTGNVTVTSTGGMAENETLTADTTGISDADGMSAPGYTYQWQTSSDGGTTWTDISGETSANYTLGDADVGNEIRVKTSYTDDNGTAETVYSTSTGTIANVNDAPTGSVTVTGTAAEDATLTADTSGIADADGLGTFAYQWQTSNDGGATWTNISGATASTYTLGDADVGNEVRVNVSYTDGNGTTETLDSATTGTIANVNDAPTSTNDTVTTAEDTAYTLAAADFGTFADVDGDSLQGIEITTTPGAGSLEWFDGSVWTAVTAPQAITKADIDAGYLRFTPSADAHGTGYASFDFKVSDGTATSTSAYTLTIDVTPDTNIENTSETYTGTAGTDTVTVSGTSNVVDTLGGDDTLTVAGTTGNIQAGVGADTITVSGSSNTVRGDWGNDTITIDGASATGNTIYGDQDDDTFTIQNAIGGNTFYGGTHSAGDTYDASALTVALTLNLVAGTVSDGTNTDNVSGIETFYAGSHTSDRIDFSGSLSAVHVDLASGAIDLNYGGSPTPDISVANFEKVDGSAYNDVLKGDSGNNWLAGLGGNDVIYGDAGIDTLDGGAGTDTLDYSVGATGGITVDLTISGSQVIGGGFDWDSISAIENLRATSFADTLTGSAVNNTIWAGAGDDTIDGGGGNDTLYGEDGNDTITGGLGNDILNGNAGADTFIMAYGDGSDQVDGGADGSTDIYDASAITTAMVLELFQTSGWYQVMDGSGDIDKVQNIETYIAGSSTADRIDFSGSLSAVHVNLDTGAIDLNYVGSPTPDVTVSNFERITGSNYHDVLYGDSARNDIRGGAGDDIIYATAGGDTLVGGAGNDTLDFSLNASGGITVKLWDPSVQTVNGGYGLMTISQFEILKATGFADTITGSSGSDFIYAGDGNDVIDGYGGSDAINAGAGADTIKFSSNIVTGDGTTTKLRGGNSTGDKDILQFVTAGTYTINPNGSEDEITGVEIYDFQQAGADTINLVLHDQMLATNDGALLTIKIDDADSLSLDFSNLSGTWSEGTSTNSYKEFTDGTYTIRVTDSTADNTISNLTVNGAGHTLLNDALQSSGNGFWIKDNIGEGFGYGMAALYDSSYGTQDGYDDFMMVKRTGDGLFTLQGGNGLSNTTAIATDTTFTAGFTGDNNNLTIASIGDFNNDGVSDFIVGALSADADTAFTGQAYIIDANGNRIAELSGLVSPANAGSAVTGIGDVNNDGYEDVLIGAPNTNGEGSAYILYGGNYTADIDANPATATKTFDVVNLEANSEGDIISMGLAGGQLGTNVAAAGDFNNDGTNDFMVSEFDSTTSGQVHIGLGGGTNSFLTIDNITLDGTKDIPLINAGDINGDGIGDIGIYESGTDTVHLFFGSSSYVAGTTNITDSNIKITSDGNHQIVNGGAVGDFNGDGLADTVVVMQGWDGTTYSNNAEIYVVYGNDGSGTAWGDGNLTQAELNDPTNALHITYNIPATEDPATFDFNVSATGDLNGDGYYDFAIGMPDLDTDTSVNSDGVGTAADDSDGAVAVIYGRAADGVNGTENLVGSNANDTLSDGGQSNMTFSAGAGDDIIQVSNNNFDYIDGGAGYDTLAFMTNSGSLDFRAVSAEITRVEEIDLAGTGQTLTLSLDNIFDLAYSSDNLASGGDILFKITSSSTTNKLVIDDGGSISMNNLGSVDAIENELQLAGWTGTSVSDSNSDAFNDTIHFGNGVSLYIDPNLCGPTTSTVDII